MTTPFAHIQTRHEPSTDPNTLESKVALIVSREVV